MSVNCEPLRGVNFRSMTPFRSFPMTPFRSFPLSKRLGVEAIHKPIGERTHGVDWSRLGGANAAPIWDNSAIIEDHCLGKSWNGVGPLSLNPPRVGFKNLTPPRPLHIWARTKYYYWKLNISNRHGACPKVQGWGGTPLGLPRRRCRGEGGTPLGLRPSISVIRSFF